MACTKIKEILQRGSQQIHDQRVEVPLLAVMTYAWESNATAQYAIQFCLIQQLRMTSIGALHLDGDLLAGLNAHAQVNVAK